MEQGQITLDRQRTTEWIGNAARFFLAAALTASQTAGGYAPFALGMVAAAGPGVPGVFALAGAGTGELLFLNFSEALPHIAVAILIVTAATSFREHPFLTRPDVLAWATAGLTLVVDGIYVIQSLAPLERATPCVIASVLAGVSAWVFRAVWLPAAGKETADGWLLLAAALALAMVDLEIAGFSLGRCLLSFLLLCGTYGRDALGGVSVGLGLGLVSDLCLGTGNGIFTAGMGLAGFFAGSRQSCRRGVAAGAVLLAMMAVLLPSGDPVALPFLAETVWGTGLFLLLPGKAFGGKRVKRETRAELPAGKELRERLMKAAGALRELYDSMGRSVQQNTDENPAVVFDRAAEKVCRGCALCNLCWQKEYTGTFNALNDATPYLLERGRALPKDFPIYFSTRCIHLPDFLAAINEELSAFLLRRQYRRQLEETRRSARGQYAQLSELLTATAAGLGAESLAFAEAVPVCRIGAALRPKEGEQVCGDTLVSFQTGKGVWCLLLADGMGCGEPARKESALTCRLLQQFLEAAIEPEAALKTINAAMALRGAETGSFTTVDLCTCDPATGEAVFYKYGAAPSYLKKGGSVRRVTGGSLPIGLQGAPAMPDITRVRLEEEGYLVMISDGVAEPSRDEWLMDLLVGWDGEDPQALAGLILTESIRREKLQDDCGIQVLYRPAAREKMV